MKKLDHRDVTAVLDAIQKINSDLDAKTLPDRLLAALGNMIESEIIAFDGFTSNEKYISTNWTNREDLYTPESLEIFKAYAYQHPLIPAAFQDKSMKIVQMTDYISQSDFERLELFNEYFRLIKVRRQIGVALPVTEDLMITCSFNRWRDDFNERDKSILFLITPHIICAIRNAFAYERLNSAMQAKSTGVIAIDSTGQISFTSEYASRLLEKYFPKDKKKHRKLPEAINGWLKNYLEKSASSLENIPNVFRKTEASGEFVIKLLVNNLTHEKTLLVEEHRRPVKEDLKKLSLTQREAEILFWITAGKTDQEIAGILGISNRTVNKHSENIYTKLGVENRTSAVLKALEVLR